MGLQLDTSGGVRLTVAAGLDEVFDSGYEMDKQPGEVRADDELFFRQDDTDLLFVQYAQSMGPGDFNVTQEDEEVDEATVRVGNKVAAEVFEFDRDIPIPQRYQEASQHWGTVDSWVEQLGVRGRTSRDKYAFKYTYGDAFSGVTTPDAVALASNSHISLAGSTVDNLETGAASADNVAIMIRSLRLQPAQDGDLASYHADGMLGPTKLHPTLTVIVGSELKPGITDNDLNYISKVYPGLVVGASEFLDSTYNTLNSNADTSYFAVSRMHKITRAKRIDMQREYVDPMYDRKRRAFYRARFSERAFAGDWGGFVGNNGTA
jgi:hypothetical protein